jgi:hypothetical protein
MRILKNLLRTNSQSRHAQNAWQKLYQYKQGYRNFNGMILRHILVVLAVVKAVFSNAHDEIIAKSRDTLHVS